MGLRVIEVEETLSSYEARKINSKKEDAIAAAILLQNYLDTM